MLTTGAVRVTGRGANIEFIIDDTMPFSGVSQGLREYLTENRALYSRGAISVNVGRRLLNKAEVGQLKQILERESGLTITRIWCDPEILADALSKDFGFGVAVSTRGENSINYQPQHNQFQIEEETTSPPRRSPGRGAGQPLRDLTPRWTSFLERVNKAERGAEALLVKTTCRSGEVIRHAGDVVVLADVNPGAEIIADGDIIVFGRLRGLAHAGASGDDEATIVALKMEAPRVKIGPYTGEAPEVDHPRKSTESRPQIAYVRRRGIYVSDYGGRFTEYVRGTLYEG